MYGKRSIRNLKIQKKKKKIDKKKIKMFKVSKN